MKSKWILLAGIFAFFTLGYLLSAQLTLPLRTGAQTTPVAPPAGEPRVGISNPAAIYCTGLGYQYEVKKDPLSGQETGFCTLPDNSACDEWDFLAGKCGQEHSYCATNGYKTQVKKDGQDPFLTEYAECVDQNGKQIGRVSQLFQLEEKIKRTGCTGDQPDSLPAQPTAKDPDASTGSPLDKIQPNPENSSMAGFALAEAIPASFDWRSVSGANWLTPVRNQAGCGSCWAFAAVGVVEAAHNIAYNNPNRDLDLSEQYLVSDCSGSGTCCGGSSYSAVQYIRNYGIPDEGCLPYADSACGCASGCSTSCTYNTGGKCSNRTCSDRCSNYATRLVSIDQAGPIDNNASAMKRAIVERGPILVSIRMGGTFDANQIYRCDPDSPTNHAVVVAGYNDAGGYWIIRNSWGATWNGDGYFKLGYGECSAEAYPSYAGLNPVNPPVISSLAPAIIESGSSNFTLTVNGSNFSTSSVVRWNNNDRATTYISSQKLQAQIPAADVANTGTALVSVYVLPPGGGGSNEVDFPIINSSTYFSKRSPADGTTGSFPEVSLEWNRLIGATDYQYCYDTVGNGSCSQWHSVGTATSAAITGLNPNTTYFWQVRASQQGVTIYANISSGSYWRFTTIPSSNRVLINEVRTSSPVHIELYNGTTGAVDISGWHLLTYNYDGSALTYTFGTFTLPPGGYVTLHEGSGTNTATDRYLNYSINWEFYSGAVSLVNPQARDIDYIKWGYLYSSPPPGIAWSGYYPSYPESDSVLGRIGAGIDTDQSQDWCIQPPTAGSQNGICRIPRSFAKYLPVNGVADLPIESTLVWYSNSRASRYLTCLDTVDDDTCNTAWVDQGPYTSDYYQGLTPGVTYYWQARAANGIHVVDADGDEWWHFTPTAYLADAYEYDDDTAHAKTIASGSPQVHSIVPDTDVDWVTFTLAKESQVLLETSGDYYGDTRMWLYDSQLNELDYNDDGGVYYFSYIDRTCGVDALPAGTYYVKVDEYYNNDALTTYQWSFTSHVCSHVFLPLTIR